MDFREMPEEQLKQYLNSKLEPDFFYATEVKGMHIVEKASVRADYILRPKPHLVENGFDDDYFAIEVKSPAVKEPRAQYRKAVVQCASYVDSLFSGKRPKFALIFPEMNYFRPIDVHHEYFTQVRAYFILAQYFNVGDFRVNSKTDEWDIYFSGGRYFHSTRGRGKHNVTKRYVGNIS